jgi:hypothetical protein
MSDLNDFFAKKDKRKKKPVKSGSSKGGASTGTWSGAEGSSTTDAGNGGGVLAVGSPKPSASGRNKDDGWIELDENKTATVNTGGRTVADFNKRETDEKEANGGDGEPSEKFCGWTTGGKQGEGEEEAGPPEEVGAAPAASYPSLADAANAPEVPKNAGPGGGGYVSRPRYGSSGNGGGFAALRKKLEEMRANDGPAAAGRTPATSLPPAAKEEPMTLKELSAMRAAGGPGGAKPSAN